MAAKEREFKLEKRIGIKVRISFYLVILAILLSTNPVYSQVGVGANFGIEADAYSGDLISGVGTDDWFYNGISGAGTIDEATALSMGYAAQLAAENNIAFDLRQSIPNYGTNNGYIWYSTRYGRDYVNRSSQDQTTFSAGKNGDNPMTSWSASPGSIPAKTDLVDSGVHMRRNGVDVTDDLWVNLMISTLATTGNHFIDFELFVSEMQNVGPSFVNSGPDEGHTAWRFDGDGNVTTIGDMIIGFSYGGSGVSGVEVRLWVDRSIFNPGSSPGGTSTFVWGGSIDGGSTYGYGQIVVPAGSLLSNVNPALTAGPPWGTTNTSGYSVNYNNDYFAEIALNFTQLGFDPRALFGAGAACDSPFSAVITKSRSSSSFTSTLKDFSGPYDFLGSASGTEVNTAIVDPGGFDSCTTGETRTLQAEFVSSSAEYVWYSLTPGVVFPDNGLSEISGVGMDNVLIDTPGEYQLGIAPLEGCTPVTDPGDIVGVWSIPCAVDDSYNASIGVPLVVNPPGILTNDSDSDAGDTLTVTTTPVVDVSNGNLVLGGDGSFTYTPDPGFSGSDSFTYEVCDTYGLCDTAQVVLNVSITTVITNRRISFRVNPD
ncbi:MAG: Ig-like domain-containing protein [Flavobacteriaceae bacterium]